jgi:hypothetical protein
MLPVSVDLITVSIMAICTLDVLLHRDSRSREYT